MEINVDPKAINEYMAKKLIESTLGEQLQKVINEQLKTFDRYDSPLKGTVDQYVRQVIQEQLATTYKDQITQAVAAALTTEKVDKLATEFVDKLRFDGRGY